MSLLLLLLVMPVCCVCPGFFLLRRLRWSADEKLAGSVGLSVIIIYLAATAIYLTGVDWRWCWLVSAMCLVLGLAVRDDLLAFMRKGQIRRQLAGFAFLLLLGLLLDAVIQHYSGGRWSADWVAHYQRALFFLQRQPPLGPNIVQPDLLPSRPPMMNLLATFFLAQFGDGFDRFQLVFLFLNLLVFFPCVLIAGLLARFGNRNVTLITCFLSLSPTVLQNATWTWTKLLTAFYVILSVALYVRGWRKNDPQRIVAAAISMAAAILVHYSAGPYAVALAIHYLLIVRARRRPFAEIAGSVCLAGALLAPWFVWSLAVFAANITFGSNSMIADSNQLSLFENIAKIGQNFLVTLLPRPFPWWTEVFRAEFFQPNRLGSLRDGFFLIYQSNLPFAWGLLGWAGVLVLMRRLLLGKDADRSIARFWLMLVVITIVLGIAVYGETDSYGVAHICLQPLTFMGLCLLAAGFHLLPRWLRCAMAVTMLADALFGIVLHFRLEMMSFRIVELAPGWDAVPLTNSLLSQFAIQNSASRFVFGLHFLSDHFVAARWMCFGLFIALLGFAACTVAKIAVSPTGGRPFAIALVGPFIVGAITSTVIHPAVDLFSANASSPAQAGYQAAMDAYRAKRFSTFLTEMNDAYLLDPSDARTRYVLRVAPPPSSGEANR